MRDFRNAKAMAQTLRAALAAKGIEITVGQSLELMAEMFGIADWNTLAAAINAEKAIPRETVSPLPVVRSPRLCSELATTLRRAIGFAAHRNHEYATLEHLLLALVEDADALASISACNANPSGLTERLVDYLDHGLTKLVMESHAEPKPTAAFQRVVQHAEIQRNAAGRSIVTGTDILKQFSTKRRARLRAFSLNRELPFSNYSGAVAQVADEARVVVRLDMAQKPTPAQRAHCLVGHGDSPA